MFEGGKNNSQNDTENHADVYTVPCFADERMAQSINELNKARAALFARFAGDPSDLNIYHGA